MDGDGGVADGGTPACAGSQMEGAACTDEGVTCDPGIGCGVKLVCASKNPLSGIGGCPISRRAAKEDVTYLDPAAVSRLAAELRAVRLATYRYKAAPERRRLGFILDDVPGSMIANEAHDQVDLYAYVSMAVAALQDQARRIDAQAQQIARLREQIAGQRGSRTGASPRPGTPSRARTPR